MRKQEWDWPEEGGRRYRTFVDARPRKTGWASPTTTMIATGYFRAVIFILKITAGAVLGLALLGCIWLIVEMLKLWK